MVTAAATATPGILARVSSYVEWGPITAGAFAAAAISFVLLTFGSAIGLTAVSPWGSSTLPAWLVAAVAALWLLITQAGSYALGGYIAGRLRAPINDALPEERYFRDGAHGFIVWAVGIVITAIVVGWTAGAVVKGGVDAAATVASGVAQGAGNAATVSSAPDPLNYSIDRMLRPGAATEAKSADSAASDAAPVPAAGIPGSPVQGDADREQARRIFLSAATSGVLAPDDRAFLANRISAVAGLPAAEAEKRVDEAFAAIQKAKTEAKEAADAARRAAAIAGFLTAAAALIAAAAAAAGAGLGGKHRDENGMFRMFGAERFW